MSKDVQQWVRVALSRPERWQIETNLGGLYVATVDSMGAGLTGEAGRVSALIVAAANAIQRFAAALDCDPVALAEHLANAHPGAMLEKLASVFGEEE